MEISEGMYVKYIRGMINGYVPPKIAKVTDCSDKDLIKIDNGQVILRNDILKASYNIIDLVEEGDYVNGHLVLDTFWNVEEDYIILIENSTDNSTEILYNKDIKYIVTKEQMESMAYEVE